MLDVNSTKKKGYGWAVSAGFYAALATISAKFITPQAFINGPWWYFAFYKMINPFFTQRTKSKFVFAGPLPNLKNLFNSHLSLFQFNTVRLAGKVNKNSPAVIWSPNG